MLHVRALASINNNNNSCTAPSALWTSWPSADVCLQQQDKSAAQLELLLYMLCYCYHPRSAAEELFQQYKNHAELRQLLSASLGQVQFSKVSCDLIQAQQQARISKETIQEAIVKMC